MSLGAILDTAIGLIFVYLLLSLFAAALQEVLANALKLRSEFLYDGIWKMLTTDNRDPHRVSPRQMPAPSTEPAPAGPVDLFRQVWGHQLIKGLSQDGQGPSYIPGRAFTTVLVDVLRSGSRAAPVVAVENGIAQLPPGAAREALETLFTEASGDLDRFRANVASWFDDAMDRTSGAYKRWAQKFTLAFGLAAAVILNVNTFDVATTLWRDPSARAAVAAKATAYAEAHETLPGSETAAPEAAPDPAAAAAPAAQPAATDGAAPAAAPAAPAAAAPAEPTVPPAEAGAAPATAADTDASAPAEPDAAAALKASRARAQDLANEIQELPLPLGWESDMLSTVAGDPKLPLEQRLARFALVLLGWALTGLAVSMGAPFWFDTLKRFVNLRAAGPKPAASS